jgi:hypothetical protein
MRSLLIAIVLSSASAAACAQPAEGTVTSIQDCIRLARAAAQTCYDPRVDGIERWDCQKMRATLDTCLARAVGSAPSENSADTGSSEMPSGAIPSETPPSAGSATKSTGIGSPSSRYGAAPSTQTNANTLSEKPAGTLAPELPTATGSVDAQSAKESMSEMESCFHASRIADAICSKLPRDPPQRSNCFQKTRAAQLQCLERVLSETPGGATKASAAPDTTRQEPPDTAAPAEAPSERVSPKQPSQTGSAGKSDSAAKAVVRTNPPALPAASDVPTGGGRPDISRADAPVGSTGANWMISETVSPLDYSPIVTALLRTTSPLKNAPTTLAVRCREKRTEILVGTDGTWRLTSGKALRVDYQINDQPAVSLPWTASADGKTASYKDDAIGLLQSLPEDGRLKINVFDGPGPGHEATFQVAGLDIVRKKIAAACNGARSK